MDKNIASMISNLRHLNNLFIEYELSESGINDIHSSHGSIIHALYNEGQLTMKELAKKINRDKSTVTVLAKKLNKNGYITIEKSKEDARVKLVKLTDKASEIQDIFYSISEDLNATLWDGVSSREMKIFIKVVHKMINNIKVGIEIHSH